MISAKEARVKTDYVTNRAAKKELDNIERLIEKVIETGNSKIICNDISDNTRRVLKYSGYHIKVDEHGRTIVSW